MIANGSSERPAPSPSRTSDIVRIYDFGESEDCLFYSMEYVSGLSLTSGCRSRDRSAAEAFPYSDSAGRPRNRHALKSSIATSSLPTPGLRSGISSFSDFGLAASARPLE